MRQDALRTLAGLISPTGGSLRIAGADVTKLRSDQRQLGMVFQNYALFPTMTVADNIAFGLRARRGPKVRIDEAVADIAGQVNLSAEQLRKNVAELSGGQQQRVAIARSLVLRPKILLLDEPLSNLDAKLRQQLRVQLKSLQRQFGITTVYVTHDQDEALSMSDRIAVMNGGRIEQVGTPREVYGDPSTEFVCTFIGEANRLAPELVGQLADVHVGATTYLRTERVSVLAPGERHTGVELEGTVVEATYEGTTSTYTVDCGAGGELRSVVLEDGPGHEVGAAVRLGFHVGDLLQFDAEGARLRIGATR